MMQKPWFKVFVWFVSTCFLFLASAVVISELRPGPSESDVMKFMEGMMAAMDRSMMGVSMNIENDTGLKSIVLFSASMLLPTVIIGAGSGFVIRLYRRRDKNV